MALNEAQEFFQELMFGTYGGMLGLLLILVIIVLVSYKVKWSGFAFIPVTILFGIMYFENVSVASNFYWSGVLMFITGAFLAVTSAYRVTQK